MALKIYNTLSGRKEEFTPAAPGRVGIYACGITVYDEAHIGHADQAVVFDVVRSYLEYSGLRVTYVRNYTDVDDKIIAKAAQTGREALEISSHFIQRSREDMALLKVRPATHEPKVSEHIPEIIDFIRGLVEKGHAYALDGDVLFEIASFPRYGALSRRKAEEQTGEVTAVKRGAGDFALWKAAKPGEPSWDSPWGRGRPGWHIECSALARKYLGETLDIHGGGLDLVFPHHENEIAQSEALHGRPFARFWMHNGLVMVDRQKMSKSLGNFYTIGRALEKVPADVIRFMILSCQYGSNIDFMESNLLTASKRVHYFYTTLLKLDGMASLAAGGERMKEIEELADSLPARFREEMDDDFGTSRFLAFLSEAFAALNMLMDDKAVPPGRRALSLGRFREEFRRIASVLRLFDEDPASFLADLRSRFLRSGGIEEEEIAGLIGERNRARAVKDFRLADGIRDGLAQRNILLRDTPAGTEWDILFR